MLKMGFAVVFYREEKEVDYLGRVVKDKTTDVSDMSDLMSDMSDLDSKVTIIVNHLKENAFITNKDVCELLSVSTATARRLLQSMSEKGIIKFEGENRGRIYKLSE